MFSTILWQLQRFCSQTEHILIRIVFLAGVVGWVGGEFFAAVDHRHSFLCGCGMHATAACMVLRMLWVALSVAKSGSVGMRVWSAISVQPS